MAQSVNTFTELNLDSHPINTRANIMTDAINATLTTSGSNQLILQNMEGNSLEFSLTDGFIPIGVKVFDNIAYIISRNPTTEEGEIGTFPSPNWGALQSAGNPVDGFDPNNFLALENNYKPLRNFYSGTDLTQLENDYNFQNDFRTTELNFPEETLVEIELQNSYDNSVNIIFTDDHNPVRLINSRFRLSDDGRKAAIADRRQSKDTNTYSNLTFGNTKLIRQSDIIPSLKFDGVITGGSHTGGGYIFYFYYMDSDGSLTDLIEESRLVSIAYFDRGANEGETTGKAVQFTISNLDDKFNSIKVYYSYATGEADATTEIREITNVYDFNGESKKIIIYGDEDFVLLDRATLNLDYSSIDTVKTISQHQNRLLLGNITNNTDSYEPLAQAASELQIEEIHKNLPIVEVGSGYADPKNVYHELGYWSGETYELGICFILTDGRGVTPAFPLRGGDNKGGGLSYTGDPITTSDNFIGPSSSIADTENTLGVFRVSNGKTLLDSNGNTIIKKLRVDTTSLLENTYIRTETNGFFFVRRERSKDCIVQGYITNTAQVPLKIKTPNTGFYLSSSDSGEWGEDYEHITDIRRGIGVFPDSVGEAAQTKIVPAPGRIWESSFHSSLSYYPGDGGGYRSRQEDFDEKLGDSISHQGVVYPLPGQDGEQHYAFYSSDMLVNAPLYNSTFNGSGKGIAVNSGSVSATVYMKQIFDSAATFNDAGGSSDFDFIFSGDAEKGTSPITVLEPSFGVNNEIKFNNFLLTNDDSEAKSFMRYISTGQEAVADKQFSSVSDRNLYFVARWKQNSSTGLDATWQSGGTPFRPVTAFQNKNQFLTVTNTQFSDYVGITMPNGSDTLGNHLRNDDYPVHNIQIFPIGNGLKRVAGDKADLMEYMKRVQEGFAFATIANIYESTAGQLKTANWKNKYANTSFTDSYFAISKRYKWDDFPVVNGGYINAGIPLAGGDCYVNYTYKRVMTGLGIPGVPTASDPSLYEDFNKDTGLTPKGFVFPIVSENNYNSALRTFENHSEIEKAIYGKDRSFYPLENIDSLRSSRQPESNGYNHGYSYNSSDRNYFSLNERSPTLNINYGNRVMVSEASAAGSFTNSYTNFRGLNFRDYNQELGEIVRIISLGNNCFCIFESGIGILPMNQRTMVSAEQGGVFLDNAQLLAENMQVISTEYGSNQQFSIINTDSYIYGCDYTKNKIWRVNASSGLELISDFAVQSLLLEYKERINSYEGKPVIKANYDRELNSVIFSYLNYYETDVNIDFREELTPEGTINQEGGFTAGININANNIIPNVYEGDGLTSEDLAERLTYVSGLIADQVDIDDLPALYNNQFGGSNIFGSSNPTIIGRTPTPSDDITGNDPTQGDPVIIDTIEVGALWFVLNSTADLNSVYICLRNNEDKAVWERIEYSHNKVASFYFNETIGKWVSKLSWNPIWAFNIQSNLYSFNALTNLDKGWKHGSGLTPYCNFYGEQDKFVFEFVLVDNPSAQKILDNLLFISNKSFPGRITYSLIENNSDLDNFAITSSGYTELLKRRHEPKASIGWTIDTLLDGVAHATIQEMSKEELERLSGGYIVFDSQIYILGNVVKKGSVFYNEILDQNGINITSALPTGWTFNTVEFGIIQQNMEYLEDHLYVEVGQDDDKSRVRDKAIKIKVIYEGYDYATIQSIISSFNYSFG